MKQLVYYCQMRLAHLHHQYVTSHITIPPLSQTHAALMPALALYSNKNGKWLPIYQSAGKRQLCLPLLPFTHTRSESINADSLNSNFLQLGRRSGGRPQRTVHPGRLPVNTVIHTTLVGLEPTTYRLLVRRATSSSTQPTNKAKI